jgi:hypothetical protein
MRIPGGASAPDSSTYPNTVTVVVVAVVVVAFFFPPTYSPVPSP